MKTLIYSFLLFLLFSACKKRNTPEPLGNAELSTKILANNLSHVWELVYGSDNHIWFTERNGKISRLDIATNQVKTLLTIQEVVANGEGGLLGMALHPDFLNNPFVYVVYNYNQTGAVYTEKVVRYRYENETLSEPTILLDNIPAANIHNGSRLLITADNKLLITTGDANIRNSAQDQNSLSGKILRINLDGTIPADNPVSNNPMWTLGHRNAQGLVQVGDKIYASEHGQDTDDEINLIEKGRNYGWPAVEGFCNEPDETSFCTENNVKEPLTAWTPTIATAGLTYYNHDLIPQWKNSLLLVTLKGSRLIQLALNSSGTTITGSKEFFSGDFGRLRAICTSPNGKIYFSTSNGTDDKIIEISREN